MAGRLFLCHSRPRLRASGRCKPGYEAAGAGAPLRKGMRLLMTMMTMPMAAQPASRLTHPSVIPSPTFAGKQRGNQGRAWPRRLASPEFPFFALLANPAVCWWPAVEAALCAAKYGASGQCQPGGPASSTSRPPALPILRPAGAPREGADFCLGNRRPIWLLVGDGQLCRRHGGEWLRAPGASTFGSLSSD